MFQVLLIYSNVKSVICQELNFLMTLIVFDLKRFIASSNVPPILYSIIIFADTKMKRYDKLRKE